MLGSSAEINFEGVAAQDPDLILALYSGLTDEDYESALGDRPDGRPTR